MTLAEEIITIGLCAVATMLTRFLPFLVFRADKPTPKYIRYLGKALPAAIFGMLVVYCLKGVNIASAPYGMPELIGVLAVIVLHLAFRKTLLSIVGGTVIYVLLVNLIFV